MDKGVYRARRVTAARLMSEGRSTSYIGRFGLPEEHSWPGGVDETFSYEGSISVCSLATIYPVGESGVGDTDIRTVPTLTICLADIFLSFLPWHRSGYPLRA